MKCRCGGETAVLDSRKGELDTIRRRRECETCGGRFTTYESTVSPLVVLRHRKSKAAKQRRLYNALPPDERRALKKRGHTRAAARREAQASGRPVNEVYAEWGVS